MEKIIVPLKREEGSKFGDGRIDLLYEDTYIVVINKPSGMLTVPYPGSKVRTAIGILGRMMRKKGTYAAHHRPLVVHRLDRDTSGIMMFALTEYMQRTLMETWKIAVAERVYRAVTENPRNSHIADEGLIDAPLAYNAYNIGFVPKEGDRPSDRAYKVKSKGKNKSIYEKHLDFSSGIAKFKTVEARTRFKVLERGPTHTLFELRLETGKKNQIRAHLASQGYTVAGDESYRAKTDPFGRLALHACALEFTHPATGKRIRFEIDEPCDWLSYVRRGDFYPAEPIWQTERKAFRSVKREMFKFNNC